MLVKQSASFIRVVAVCTRHSESIEGTINADVFHAEQLNAIVEVEMKSLVLGLIWGPAWSSMTK
jgi:hypothetical protein